MTKKIIAFAGFVLLFGFGVGASKALAIEVTEVSIYKYSTAVAVSISTSAYTKIPTGTELPRRTRILVDNPSSNSGVMHGHLGNCTSTAIATTVLGPIEISPTTNTADFDLGPGVCLWLLSRHTSAENATVQEVSQRQ